MNKNLMILLLVMIFIMFFYSNSLAERKIEKVWTIKVIDNDAIIRDSPEMNATPLYDLKKDTILDSKGMVGNWFVVILDQDEVETPLLGYIHMTFVQIVREKKTTQDIIKKKDKDKFILKNKTKNLININFSMGMGFMIQGDVNSAIQDLNNVYMDLDTYLDDYSYTLSDNFRKLNFGGNFELSFIYNLNSKLGIGLGIEYLAGRRIDSVSIIRKYYGSYRTYTDSYSIYTERKVSAFPIKAGLFYSSGNNSKMKSVLSISVGYYPVKYMHTINESWYTSILELDSNGGGIGINISVGGKYPISKNISLFVEGIFRYARFSNLRGEETFQVDGHYERLLGTVKMWNYTVGIPGRYNWMGIISTNLAEVVGVGKSAIDFSGGSIRFGLSVGLF